MANTYYIEYNPWATSPHKRGHMVFATSAETALREMYGSGIKVMARRGDEKEWVQTEKPDIRIYQVTDRRNGEKNGAPMSARYYRVPEWVKRPL